jgi:DNA-binding NarL/FixJ family response regulator
MKQKANHLYRTGRRHPFVLHAVSAILRTQPDLNVVAVCSDGPAAEQPMREFVPDVAVFDVAMPWLTGLEVLPGLAEAPGKTRFSRQSRAESKALS